MKHTTLLAALALGASALGLTAAQAGDRPERDQAPPGRDERRIERRETRNEEKRVQRDEGDRPARPSQERKVLRGDDGSDRPALDSSRGGGGERPRARRQARELGAEGRRGVAARERGQARFCPRCGREIGPDALPPRLGPPAQRGQGRGLGYGPPTERGQGRSLGYGPPPWARRGGPSERWSDAPRGFRPGAPYRQQEGRSWDRPRADRAERNEAAPRGERPLRERED